MKLTNRCGFIGVFCMREMCSFWWCWSHVHGSLLHEIIYIFIVNAKLDQKMLFLKHNTLYPVCDKCFLIVSVNIYMHEVNSNAILIFTNFQYFKLAEQIRVSNDVQLNRLLNFLSFTFLSVTVLFAMRSLLSWNIFQALINWCGKRKPTTISRIEYTPLYSMLKYTVFLLHNYY